MSLSWTVDETSAAPARVRLVGSITEEADFAPLVELAAGDALELDLGAIDEINSCGVREWIHFVRDLSRNPHPTSFVRCSPAIVRQLNMISNFAGVSEVRSVLLPYYCESCSHEENRLLDLRAPGNRKFELSAPCPACGEELVFDDLPDSYLTFAEDLSWRRAAG